MSPEDLEPISTEYLQRLIKDDISGSRSIYAPSGPPEPRLRRFFTEISTRERTVEMVTSTRLTIELIISLDLSPLAGADPELRRNMTAVLLHDGHRRLAAAKISVADSSYQENPERLVYTCTEASKSRIKKLLAAWNR